MATERRRGKSAKPRRTRLRASPDDSSSEPRARARQAGPTPDRVKAILLAASPESRLLRALDILESHAVARLRKAGVPLPGEGPDGWRPVLDASRATTDSETQYAARIFSSVHDSRQALEKGGDYIHSAVIEGMTALYWAYEADGGLQAQLEVRDAIFGRKFRESRPGAARASGRKRSSNAHANDRPWRVEADKIVREDPSIRSMQAVARKVESQLSLGCSLRTILRALQRTDFQLPK